MKKILIILITLTVSVFTSCEHDLNSEQHEHELSNFKTENGSFSQFNLGRFTEPLKIYNKNGKSKNKFELQSQSDGFYFNIDTSNVVRRYDGITESYTIRVSTEQTALHTFQNVVIAKYQNLAPKAYLYTYTPDEAYRTRFENNSQTHFTGTCNLTQLDINNIRFEEQSCTTMAYQVCNYGGDLHSAGTRCTQVFSISITNCLDSPSGGTSNNTSPNPTGDTSGGSPGSGQGTGGGVFYGIPTSPIGTIDLTDILEEPAASQFNFIQQNITLSAAQTAWVTANAQNVSTVFNFLSQNNTVEGKKFLKEALNILKNGGEIDFQKQIILKNTFVNTKTDCIHKKLINSPNLLYSNTLSNFNDSTNNNLTFEIANTQNGDWGITKGNPNISNNFTITINPNIDSGSNLMKIITLSHELIYAYMFSTLEKSGFINYDNNGNPILNINCGNLVNYNNSNLNNLSVNERFLALFCAMNQNGTLNAEWTHDLYNLNVFNANTYRSQLENFILDSNDWNNESINFKNEAISIFGNNWKQEISKAVSWIGLESTADYNNYINNYSTNIPKIIYLNSIRTKIENSNKNCP